MRAGVATAAVALSVLAASACFRPPALPTASDRAAWALRMLPDAAPTTAEAAAACPNGGLDEATAVSLALARDPALRARRAAVRAAAAQAEAPRAREPELRVGTVRLDRLLDGTPRFGVGVRAFFEAPGVLDARAFEGALDTEIADADADDAARRRVAEVRRRHARAAARQHLLALREAAVERARGRVARARDATKRHAAPAIDGTRARLALAGAVDAAARARAQVQADMAALSVATGVPEGCRLVQANETTATAEDVPASELLVAEALAARPAVRRAWARLAQTDARTFRARAERWPRLDFAQVEWFTHETPDAAAWGLTLGVTLPIFALGGGEVEAAEAEGALRRAEAELAAQRVADEVRLARAELSAQRRRLDALDANLAALEPAALEARAQESAEVDPTSADARAALEALDALKRRRLDAALDLREAQIALDAAMSRMPGSAPRTP